MTNLEVFLEYVNNFPVTNKDIKRKIDHSIRVGSNARRIADSLNLDADLVSLVEFIGLIHDIGRFSQWEKYGTYDDSKSVDHALNGVKVLFEENLISKFNIYSDCYDDIKKAVFYHNKYKVPDDIEGKTRMICNIIRDADKLDLLYILGNGIAVMDEDNDIINKEVAEDFLAKKSILRSKCVSASDKILFKMAFVFDLNYTESFKILKEQKSLDKFYNNLRYLSKYKIYYDYAVKYVLEKIS